MKERVSGMVLSAATIGEYDKRVVLLTRERGRISAFARGARRPKSTLSAGTEPFTFGDFYIYRGRDYYTIEQIDAKNYFPKLRTDLDDLYMAMYFCEVAQYFTREGMEAKEELNLLYMSLSALSLPSLSRQLVRYIYELRMLSIAGVAPAIYSCTECGGESDLHHFYPEDAGVICDHCYKGSGGITLSETTIYTMQRVLSAPIQKLYTFTVSDQILSELSIAVGKYFSLHTDKAFKALSFLENNL